MALVGRKRSHFVFTAASSIINIDDELDNCDNDDDDTDDDIVLI